jgi:hypothetical protein
MTTTMIEKTVMVRREFIVPLEFLNVRLIFPQESGPTPRNPPRESAAPPPLRFAIPTVADGRAYVGAKYEVDVYGLLPAYKK